MSSAAASTTSLTTIASTSSITPLQQTSKPRKNFEATFAALQSTFGFGGTAPMLPTMPTRKASKKSKSAASPAAAAQALASAQRGAPKDYEAAYAAMCSSYGFGGASAAPGLSLRPKA